MKEMYNKKNKNIIKDSARFVEWHGHHSGKYYNRSDSRYINEKCSECKETKPLSAMYAKTNDKWICNACMYNRGKIESNKRTVMYHKGSMVLSTINQLISTGQRVITSRTIRIFNDIDKSDRSSINFIWRNLKFLNENGFIEKYSDTTPIKYRLPLSEIKIEGMTAK
ncbi:hypothetical protein QKV40_gp06 [Varidnaviria sp.]|uniref:Uncharacterized protein n=1 Tax=Lokiarchaeia virus SkuldV1 TaxID=3058189 RepID=A0AA46MYK0_9VIRU|nr:hypothetical protein QKV40_gp06 [Varidnaviria sp.]UPO70960.1 hypothetical protein 11324_00006 [Lokiarchaeia virus SkuldV1]